MAARRKGKCVLRPVRFVKWFRHWKTGEIIRAEKYGYKAFPLPLK